MNTSTTTNNKKGSSKEAKKDTNDKPDKGYIKRSKSNNWGTPQHIKDEYTDWYDPCPFNGKDGLTSDWQDKNFVNPPYSALAEWCKKCKEQYLKGKTIHLLIPARTDTKYFHDYVVDYATVTFIKGRLKFISLDDKSLNQSAPFPSIMCKFEHKKTKEEKLKKKVKKLKHKLADLQLECDKRNLFNEKLLKDWDLEKEYENEVLSANVKGWSI
tara:strand:- start:616 stop:1254 length:639 start_codon:yes stop_codon:yes gene_type:complete